LHIIKGDYEYKDAFEWDLMAGFPAIQLFADVVREKGVSFGISCGVSSSLCAPLLDLYGSWVAKWVGECDCCRHAEAAA
jgi:hypothetical protein